MPEPTPFRLDVTDEQLADLHARLDRTRRPTAVRDAGWTYGTEPGFQADLLDYWRTTYDWRAAETRLNAIPQFTVPVQDMTIHYAHVRGTGPAPIPLLFCHGWPGSYYEVHRIIGPLTDPAPHGGDPADAFDVVAPSLPGYGFSPDPQIPGVTASVIADRFAALMGLLGYHCYGVQGGDWGAMVTTCMALQHPGPVTGLHLNMPGARPYLGEGAAPLSDAEQAMLDRYNSVFKGKEDGYQAIQGTKPQTLAYALTDSPAGLAAWIAEKFHTWTDHDGDVFAAVSRDDLLTNIMIYWLSGCIGSSTRLYYESARQLGGLARALRDGEGVTVPTGFAAFPGEILSAPREWLERSYNLTTYHRYDKGGHFAALERPDELVESIREHFRPLR